MKNKIEQIIVKAVQDAFDKGLLPSSEMPDILVEETKHESHGDYATNIALKSASIQKMTPRQIAEHLTSCIEIDAEDSLVEKVETAGPGFINFFLSNAAWQPVVDQVLLEDSSFGSSDIGKNEKVQVEFVSANPTGPLHVGHGRGAAVGDAVGNILSFAGFDVQKEYYINDSGRQINTLGRSVWLRLQQKTGKEIQFPDDCYQGDYIKQIADEVLAQFGEQTLFDKAEEDAVAVCARYAAGKILDEIKQDLSDFGVEFDQWFSEQSLYDSKRVEETIDQFQSKGMIYEKDGAKWFRTQDFGDEKDRVVVRNNGLTTYFASDIAYHREKFDRGFNRVIDVWGADHHGYIKRIDASVKAWADISDQKEKVPKDQFDVILVQLVNLLRGGVPLQMSTRAGQFVTLKDIVNEVGKDAARFMFLSRSYDSGLDFDLELAKQKNADNPVYYVQYVHARITGILLKAKEQQIISDTEFHKGNNLNLLTAPEEIKLIKILNRFQDNVEKSALTLHPHVIFTFLMNLAGAFHGYYNKHKVICDEAELTHARLSLVLAVKKVIANGLTLLGVSAPDRM